MGILHLYWVLFYLSTYTKLLTVYNTHMCGLNKIPKSNTTKLFRYFVLVVLQVVCTFMTAVSELLESKIIVKLSILDIPAFIKWYFGFYLIYVHWICTVCVYITQVKVLQN